MNETADELVQWFKTQARPFLEKHRPERVEELARDCARLEKANASLGQELSVCFLGNSGVGKSTLINALIGGGQSVVPSGGVGPLTAQALTVRFGTSPKIEAEYHSSGRLNQLVFGLENSWKAEFGRSGQGLTRVNQRGRREAADQCRS
jgi:energy-coupling factor transporter ATP-binding protein EcfA2